MSTVVPSHTDEGPSDSCHPNSIIVTKLLSRPQTAVPSLPSPKQKNQSVLSSIEVIGQDKDGTDIKSRIKSAFSGQSGNRRFKHLQNTDLFPIGSNRPYRIQSAQSSVNLRANNGDVKRIKEAILQKGYSSPNLGQSADIKSLIADSKQEDINQSRPVVRKAVHDSKKNSLSIKSASVVLISRPSSSASIAKRFNHIRPKTAATAVVSQEPLKKDLENGRANDEPPETLGDNGDKGATQTTEPSPGQSNVPASTGVDKSATLSTKSSTGILKEADVITEPLNAQGVAVVKGSDHESVESTENQGKVSSSRPENVVSHSSAISKTRADQDGSGVKGSNELALNLKGENVNAGDLASPKSVETGITFRRSQRSPPRQVTSPERDLSPVLCSPSPLKQTLCSLPDPKAPGAENRLTLHSGSEEISNGNSDTRLHILELLSYNKTEPIPDISNASNSPSPNLVSSSRVYKMAKVEMYEKSNVKQARISILDEIKKQNMLLEERNSESRWDSERSKKPTSVVTSETNNDSSTLVAEKGNVCGSPGFKFLSEQLRSMNERPGSHSNLSTRKSTSKAVRDPQGDGTSKKLDTESKSSGIRPLSEYILKSSPDNLRVTGGTCTYKNGDHAVSNAVGNMATQAGIVSKVSLQVTASKCDNLENRGPDGAHLHSKVHVSLSYLKEKNKVNASGIAFRHRLDGYLDQTPTGLNSFSPRNKTQILSAISSANEFRPSQNTTDICNDSGNENTDSEKAENDKELYSASSTPTATFSGSELLYPSDGVHRSHGEELSASDMPGYERERQKLRDLEIGNRRPTSRSKRASYSVVDKVSFDRERDDLRALNNSLPAKAPVLRNPVHRNSLVRGEPMISNRPLGPNSNRESEDLVAMGTIWSPANNNNNSSNAGGGGSSTAPTRSSSNTTGSNKSIPLNNNNNISNSNSIPQRKPVTVSMSTSARLGHCNGTFGGGGKNTNRENVKEVEPKYSDPLIGAPASFQQRLMDLASLEAETIRWERTKRVKKKPKDRDS